MIELAFNLILLDLNLDFPFSLDPIKLFKESSAFDSMVPFIFIDAIE